MTLNLHSTFGVIDDFPLSQQARIGFYIHVPFCPHICPYCDFVKTSRFSRKDVDRFFAQCLVQLDQAITSLPSTFTHCTVYFGGGTPGLFPAERYAPFIEKIGARCVIEEATIETNPFTNAQKLFEGYSKIGLNRITLGAQSLCDRTLARLGRKHSRTDILSNIDWARQAGFAQVQVDLIYGLVKGIRSLSLEEEVKQLIAAGATGISGYALTIEERTLFKNLKIADDNAAADDYPLLHEVCCKTLGMTQLETSNFSFFPARHNNIYWHGLPYVGIGTGAHGLTWATKEAPFGQRYRVGPIPTERAPGDDFLAFGTHAKSLFELSLEQPRTHTQYCDESIFTLLRTPMGIPRRWLLEQFGPAKVALLEADAAMVRAFAEGMIACDTQGIRLAWSEKIRGDTWALKMAGVLNS